MSRKPAKTKGLYLRDKIWWIRYVGPDGKLYRESCETESKTEAMALLEKRRVMVREGKLPEIKKMKVVNFEELAKEYSEWAKRQKGFKVNKRYLIGILLKSFKDTTLSQITTELVEQYQTKRMQDGLKPATINREIACLKHMITKAVEWEMCSEETFKKVRKAKQLKENNRRLRYLSWEEAQTLIAKSDSHLRPIVITALNTGMGKGEILGLKWEQVDLRHSFILLDDTKNGERREIPINETLRATLSSLPRHITSPYVFWQGNGERYLDVKTSFNSTLGKAGIKDFHFHDLRHTFASWLIMAGIDLTTVKELLGHKDIKMTLRYAHLAPEHKRLAVSILDEKRDKLHNYCTISYVDTQQFSQTPDVIRVDDGARTRNL